MQKHILPFSYFEIATAIGVYKYHLYHCWTYCQHFLIAVGTESVFIWEAVGWNSTN